MPHSSEQDIVCFKNPTVLIKGQFQKVPYFCFSPDTGEILSSRFSKFSHIRDMTGYTIVPGFIDLQINGAYGADFTLKPEQIVEVATSLPATGVTAFAPTLISSDRRTYQRISSVFSKAKAQKSGARILKPHFEGPFIKVKGAHPPAHVPTDMKVKGDSPEAYLEAMQDFYGMPLEKIGMITLAPELFPDKRVITELVNRGVKVALGHSEASLREALEAVDAGAKLFTHLFNAMRTSHHRDPSLAVFPLMQFDEFKKANSQTFYSLIVDGFHVHSDLVRFAISQNRNLVMVTDAMAGLGLQENETVNLGASSTEIKRDIKSGSLKAVSSADDQVLAGSVVTMLDGLHNLKQILPLRWTWEQVLRFASLNPARLLGVEEKKDLRIGGDADFLVLEGDLQSDSKLQQLEIVQTYIRGKAEFSRPIRTEVFSGNQAKYDLGIKVAQSLFDLIKSKNKIGKKTILGLATGSTPIHTYQEFIKLVAEHKDPSFLKNLITFNLDEYVGLGGSPEAIAENPQSYRHFMDKHLFDELVPYGLNKNQTFVPVTHGRNKAEIDRKARAYEEKLHAYQEKYGGIDLQILGIGSNGHIGFSEPGTPFQSRTHRVELEKSTIEANARFFESIDKVPKEAITMGINNILEAKEIYLLAYGENKAPAVQCSLLDPVSTNCPASALRLHGNVTYFVDDKAYSPVTQKNKS